MKACVKERFPHGLRTGLRHAEALGRLDRAQHRTREGNAARAASAAQAGHGWDEEIEVLAMKAHPGPGHGSVSRPGSKAAGGLPRGKSVARSQSVGKPSGHSYSARPG